MSTKQTSVASGAIQGDAEPVTEGAGVATEEGDAVGARVGCGVPAGDGELAGLGCEVGRGVVFGGGVMGAGLSGVADCTVVGVTPAGAVCGDGGLTRR
jgi:hypothetical protein